MELLTAAQMRALEQAAIAGGAVTGLELMERAGRGVVEAVLEEWPELAATAHRAVVLCGPGNNGGDGFVVARLLRERGWEVEVFLHGDPERLPPDARVNYERWRGMGGVRTIEELFSSESKFPRTHAHFVVDGGFGTGLTRLVPEGLRRAFYSMFMGYWDARCVAIDVPSGLCADSGKPLVPEDYPRKGWPALDGHAAEAVLTVTFHRAKPGHFLGAGPMYCGRVVVKDIGLGNGFDRTAVDLVQLRPGYLPVALGKGGWDHKYTHGHALILSGPSGRGGAARLAARAALRIGAGLVTVGASADAVPEHAARLDAIMLREVEGAEDLDALLSDRRINALCLGPGLGTGAAQAELVAGALGWHLPPGLPLIDATDAQAAAWHRRHGHRPAVVLDADALTLLSRDPALFAALHDRCVLTPHAGEFARLFPDLAAKLAERPVRGPAYSKVDATREAAARAGCVVLFKGPDTVIAAPGGACSVNSAAYDRAAPWLATAGSGDVLAGMIAGLLARGFTPMQAAGTAAWLHVEAARSFGPGLIAEDLPEELPKVFRALGL